MSGSPSIKDQFNLERFITVQKSVIDSVLTELRDGRKLTHWMWFIFPQLKGLGRSPDADYYGISSLAEAQSYLKDATLGPRLLECTRLVNDIQNRSIQHIFGHTDSMKFRSCMTLFSQVDPTQSLFMEALNKYFGGQPDALTIDLLRQAD